MKKLLRGLETAYALDKHKFRAKVTGGMLLHGVNPKFSVSSVIQLGNGAVLKIGDNFKMGRDCKIVVYPNGNLTIGDNVSLTDNVCIQCMDDIKISSNVGLAPYSFVIDYNHDYLQKNLVKRRVTYLVKKVRIGENVWIGAHAIVLPGVEIGERAVIGANSTVTRDVPGRSVAVGNPARVVKSFEEEVE